MRKDTAAGLLAVAVLAMVLFAGCGKSKKSEQTMPGQVPGRAPTGMTPEASGQRPGAYGPQAGPSVPAQPTEPAKAEPSGPSYQERYKQGELTAEELSEEYELQKVERELGYPVGP